MRFVSGIDATPKIYEIAENLPLEAWKVLSRDDPYDSTLPPISFLACSRMLDKRIPGDENRLMLNHLSVVEHPWASKQRGLSMRHLSLLVIVYLFASNGVRGQEPMQTQDRVPVIATSGQVEIAAIRITRETVSGAAKEANLTNMQIELWFTRPPRSVVLVLISSSFSIWLPLKYAPDRFSPRTSDWPPSPFCRARWRPDRRTRFEAKGPVVAITLDAPARNASKIKSLKGKASLSRSAYAPMQFTNSRQWMERLPDHPKLKGFPIRAWVKVANGSTEVTLNVPKQHARLTAWGLVEDNQLLSISSESESRDNKGTVTVKKTCRGDHLKTAFLGLVIAEPSETQTLNFDFKDVELP